MGRDYPHGFVRWTEGRNMEAVLDSVAAGTFDPVALLTHRIPFEKAPSAYEMIATGSESYCGILLEYPENVAPSPARIPLATLQPRDRARIGVGFVGAGSFAQTFLLPPLRSDKRVQFTRVATKTVLSAADVGKRFAFNTAVAAPEDVFTDDETDAVVIATTHDHHVPGVIAALDALKHVFVEKPLAQTSAECRELVAKAA